jgi:Zn-dependent protease with chaperone function
LPLKKLIFLLALAQLLSVMVVHADETESADMPELVPIGISDIYSDVDMRVRLAAKPNAAPCVAESCESNQEFDARVQLLGAQLSASAYALYPNLKKRVAQFTFNVADKKEPGTASNGAGKVVLFRGLQELELNDDALSFVMAREMGHVIGKHHTKNTSTKLIISALASVAFPALAVISASSAAAQATTATTLLTSAASTATSMVGSEVAMAKMKPSQLVESDEIALKLLSNLEWDLRATANILQFDDSTQNGWTQDLQASDTYLQKMIEDEELALLPLEDGNFIAEAETSGEVNLIDEPVDLAVEEKSLPLGENTIDANTDPSAESSPDVVTGALH